MKDDRYTFTVFTATYNRAHTLHRVFESLRAQTFRDFEWLVVDDGSSDATQAVLEAFRSQQCFPMRVIRQDHRGKPTAFNRGVQEAKGMMFLPLDSDDACTPRALELFHQYWESIPHDERKRFSGVAMLCEDQYGKAIGDPFPWEVSDSDVLELKYVYDLKGEKWICCLTDILRVFPFPGAHVATFIPESVVYTRIARKYKIRCVNQVLRIYYRNEPDSITNQRRIVAPSGKAYAHLERLNCHFDYFRYSPRKFLLSFVHYVRFCIHGNVSFTNMLLQAHGWWRRVMLLIAFPVAYWFVV
ncbi:MAG: glycosyltransferase family 2 protein, partial [Nitrospirota bacterium]